MKKLSLIAICSLALFSSCNNSSTKQETKKAEVATNLSYIDPDYYVTAKGDSLDVTVVGHGSLMFQYGGKVIHVDPYSKVADYSQLPKADLVLLTHEHSDHLDSTAIALIKTDATQFIMNKTCNEILGYGSVVSNGDTTSFNNISIEAVPAYNIVNKRPDSDEYYHPKGIGNGYVLTFDNLKVYVAGDTENIPEMDNLKNTIDIAFLPKNLPYTMTDEMFSDAALKVISKYLYPYHMTDFDENKIKSLIGNNNINIIVKPMSHKDH